MEFLGCIVIALVLAYHLENVVDSLKRIADALEKQNKQ
jgi:hypothetical protein